jgi:cytidyltransferase-like protein
LTGFIRFSSSDILFILFIRSNFSMQAIDIRFTTIRPAHLHSLCGFLGSFDPIHKGHEWMIETLLERFDAVLLLVPGMHFEKQIRFQRNATLEQRLEMLTILANRKKERIAVGLAYEVLFIRLADDLHQRFPSTAISFGMGNDTYERVLASKTYYERLGLAWNEQEQAKLEQLQKTIVVFGRSSHGHGEIVVPEQVRGISSTLVRETVRELRRTPAPESLWQERLATMISPEILQIIRQKGLYHE